MSRCDESPDHGASPLFAPLDAYGRHAADDIGASHAPLISNEQWREWVRLALARRSPSPDVIATVMTGAIAAAERSEGAKDDASTSLTAKHIWEAFRAPVSLGLFMGWLSILALGHRPNAPVDTSFAAVIPNVASVVVVGDFNQWDKRRGVEMHKPDHADKWVGHISLTPGRYRYRYFVDDTGYASTPMSGKAANDPVAARIPWAGVVTVADASAPPVAWQPFAVIDTAGARRGVEARLRAVSAGR